MPSRRARRRRAIGTWAAPGTSRRSLASREPATDPAEGWAGVTPVASGRAVGVGGEALAAAALGGHVRIAEHELFVEPAFQEIDLGAVHQRQAVRVDQDAHAVLLEHAIVGALFAGEVDGVAP